MKNKIYTVQLYDKYMLKLNKLAVLAVDRGDVEDKLKKSNYDYHDFDIFIYSDDIEDVIV